MNAILIVHIAAGSLSIVSGVLAVFVRKGGLPHRRSGGVFAVAMLTTAALSIYLAAFVSPSAPGGAPPQASAIVGLLTLYFVVTGWMTVRRKPASVGPPEISAAGAIMIIAVMLVVFGLQARSAHVGRPGDYVPYFVFGSFASIAAGLDLKMIIQGGVSGTTRIARHLWRMCFAWFFACAFFFIGQQRVMPSYIHGSPILIAVAIAPLLMMIYWLARVYSKGRSQRVHRNRMNHAAGGRT